MPHSPARQRWRAEAERRCRDLGHDLGRWANNRYRSTAACRRCKRTVVVTSTGILPEPPGGGATAEGTAPYYPCLDPEDLVP